MRRNGLSSDTLCPFPRVVRRTEESCWKTWMRGCAKIVGNPTYRAWKTQRARHNDGNRTGRDSTGGLPLAHKLAADKGQVHLFLLLLVMD